MKKFFKNFSLLGVIMLGLCVVLGVGDVSGAIYADGAAAAEDLPDAGKVLDHGTDGALETLDFRELRPEMIKDPIENMLIKIRPDCNELDTILRYLGTNKTNNFEFKWYSMGTRPVTDVVKTVDATEATGKSDFKDCYVDFTIKGSTQNLDETDNIAFPTVMGADGKPLTLLIVEKTGNTFSATCSKEQMTLSQNQYSIPTIAADDEFQILSRSASELDVKSPALSFLPEPSTGYCQIHMAQVAQSFYQKTMDLQYKFGEDEINEQIVYEMRRRMEGSILFGHGDQVWNKKAQKMIYRMLGIAYQIPNDYELDNTTTDGQKELIALTKKIFVGNSGAKERYMIAGADFVEAISNMQKIDKQQQATQTEVIFGIKWSKIETNFGTLMLSQHDILNEYGWSKKAIVIDPQFLRKWQLTPFGTKTYDGKELAMMNGEFTVFYEAFGVAVYNPDAHAIVHLKS